MDVTISIGSLGVSRYRTNKTRAILRSEWLVRNSRELITRVTFDVIVGAMPFMLRDARHKVGDRPGISFFTAV